MAKIVDLRENDSVIELKSILDVKIDDDADVNKVVADIISDVRKFGDEAVFEYTQKFDSFDVNSKNVRVTQDEIEEAYENCSDEIKNAMELSANRIEAYHQKQYPDDMSYRDNTGARLGWKWTPIENIGLYVPGGQAAYPSSVLMNAIPARIAGCKRMVMVVPTQNGELNPVVLVAAKMAGVDEIYKVGGAQAIAALAYGTESIPAVDKIVGPGNAYVAAAKKQVFGQVGIDMVAGPSDILVISDKNSNPRWVAIDLLSQAEHDKDARAILVTDDAEFVKQVVLEVNKFLETLSRKEIARKSWETNGIIVLVRDISHACEVANIIAPEHLELAVNDAHNYEKYIHNAGALFVGRYTPEAIGDYVAGPSHVLPTSGGARFSSGLGVFDFIKRTSIISCEKKTLDQIGVLAESLANEEGLQAHALSVAIRMSDI